MFDRAFSRIRTWFGDLPLKSKGVVIVLGPAGILSLLIWVLVSFVFLYKGAQASSNKSVALLTEVYSVEARLFESIATFRGILAQSSDEFRQRHTESRHELERSYIRVLELCGDSEEQQIKWRLFIEKVHELERLFEKFVDLPPLSTTTANPPSPEIVVRSIDKVTREARLVLEQFRFEESKLARQKLTTLEERQETVSRIAVLGILISFFIMGFAWTAFSHGLMAQLMALRVNLDEYRAGEPLTPFALQRDEVGTLASAFRETASQVRQKDLEIQNFVYSVSHDLRSPLVNLEGFTRELEGGLSVIRAELENQTTDKSISATAVAQTIQNDIDPAMHFIRTSVRRLANIVDGLLRMSRLGQLVLKVEEVPFREILNEIITTSKSPCKDIDVIVADEVPKILVSDRYSLEQIFGNLVSNACKYLKPATSGEIEIGVSLGDSDKSGLCVYVKDNGVGIAPAHQEKVFKMFERLRPDLAPGEGMGLAFVQRVVAKLEGRIWFTSTADQGSTFFVYLPGVLPAGSHLERRHTEAGD